MTKKQNMPLVCTTSRLVIRRFDHSDAEFIVRLLNEESFIRHIADKHVRTTADAIKYLTDGPIASYRQYGFGLNMVMLKNNNQAIGMCGLLKRDELEFPDLGYAFLPEFCGLGYANEAAEAVIKEAITTHSLETLAAVTALDNDSSNRLLKKQGFSLTGTIELYGALNNYYQYCTKDKTSD